MSWLPNPYLCMARANAAFASSMTGASGYSVSSKSNVIKQSVFVAGEATASSNVSSDSAVDWSCHSSSRGCGRWNGSSRSLGCETVRNSDDDEVDDGTKAVTPHKKQAAPVSTLSSAATNTDNITIATTTLVEVEEPGKMEGMRLFIADMAIMAVWHCGVVCVIAFDFFH